MRLFLQMVSHGCFLLTPLDACFIGRSLQACCASFDALPLCVILSAVAALRAFQKALSDPGGRLHSWRPGLDPCGAPNCSLGDITNTPQGWHNTPSMGPPVKHNSSGMPLCNYFGVACQQWRVERLVLSCNGVDIACAALQGSLAEEVANLTALRVLDLEVYIPRNSSSDNAFEGQRPKYMLWFRLTGCLLRPPEESNSEHSTRRFGAFIKPGGSTPGLQ